MSDDTTKDVTTREATAMLRTRLLRYKPSRRDGIAADLAMFALSFASPGYRDLLRNAVDVGLRVAADTAPRTPTARSAAIQKDGDA